MSKLKISTTEVRERAKIINKYIDELDQTIDKVENILKNLSYNNNTYYSSASINLYNHFIENSNNIRQLHQSYKRFINSMNTISDSYEREEANLLKQLEELTSIRINE